MVYRGIHRDVSNFLLHRLSVGHICTVYSTVRVCVIRVPHDVTIVKIVKIEPTVTANISATALIREASQLAKHSAIARSNKGYMVDLLGFVFGVS